MSDQKRFVIKIYDRETGGEYEFDGDYFESESQRGIAEIKDLSGTVKELAPNGHLRHQFKIWTGFRRWDDFEDNSERVDQEWN
ncbi:hypothetical protein N9948_01305 [bacterium]|nr:hypothetical protein [bacterium]